MKQFRFPLVIMMALLMLQAVTSCTEKAKESQSGNFNLDSARQSIEKQNAAFQKAFENSDSVALGNLFTSDAKMMMPGSPSIVGRSAITSMAAVFVKMNIKRQAKTTGVWGCGDLVVEEGVASLFDQKGNELDHAKYLVVWKKEDGQWKLFRDMWNSDLAPVK